MEKLLVWVTSIVVGGILLWGIIVTFAGEPTLLPNIGRTILGWIFLALIAGIIHEVTKNKR